MMNFLDSNLSGSYISTLPKKKREKKKKKVDERGKYKTVVTNSIFIHTFPSNPGLEIQFGHNLQ